MIRRGIFHVLAIVTWQLEAMTYVIVVDAFDAVVQWVQSHTQNLFLSTIFV